MLSPTLYFLHIKHCDDEWAIFESHMCQGKGCFETEPQLVGWFDTKEAALQSAKEWNPLGGIVDSIEVEE